MDFGFHLYELQENPFWEVIVKSEMLLLELCGCRRREVEWKFVTTMLDSIGLGLLAGSVGL